MNFVRNEDDDDIRTFCSVRLDIALDAVIQDFLSLSPGFEVKRPRVRKHLSIDPGVRIRLTELSDIDLLVKKIEEHRSTISGGDIFVSIRSVLDTGTIKLPAHYAALIRSLSLPITVSFTFISEED